MQAIVDRTEKISKFPVEEMSKSPPIAFRFWRLTCLEKSLSGDNRGPIGRTMSRVLLVPFVVLGLVLSGCTASHPATIVSRAAPPSPEPDPAAAWIGAGAVVHSETPQESPLPPPPPAPMTPSRE